MWIKRFTLFSLTLFVLLTACSNRSSEPEKQQTTTIGNPTAEQILMNDPDADLLQFKDIVYIKADDASWVHEEKLGSLQEIGEVQAIYDSKNPYENEMSTKLAPGTKIYESAQAGYILVVQINGKEIRYLALLEG